MRTDHDVLVSGAGPVGLMLAAELALGGVDVAVLERHTAPDTTIKAGSVAAGAVHALDRRGLLEAGRAQEARMMARVAAAFGRRLPRTRPRVGGHFAAFPLRPDLIEPGPDDPGPPSMLAIAQAELETILRDRVAELGVPVHRGITITDVTTDPTTDDGSGVTVGTDGATVGRWTARWLVGADGGRSLVRRAVGIGFPGTDPEITGRQALVDLADAEDLEPGWHHGPRGVWCVGPVPGRILTVEFDGPPADRDAPVTLEELEKSLRHVTGATPRITAVHSATRWSDAARQASTYRAGRVLLAGDAAHVHPPFGGQGLALGLGDAMNLGWKLAAVVRGDEPSALLDTYDPERRPAAEAVLELARAQVALMRTDPKTRALRRLAGEVLATPAGVSAVARRLSGMSVPAPIARPGDDPLVGHLVPETVLDDGRRLAEVARDGRWTRVVTPPCPGPAVPEHRTTVVRGPRAMLVRPDGVVAWAAPDPDDQA